MSALNEKPTSIRLAPELLNEVKAAADELGVPFTVFIRMTLKRAVGRRRQKAA